MHAGGTQVAEGRELTVDLVASEMDGARTGLSAQLESFTHNSTEFLRREQDLLLHGHGVPRTATEMAGRPVVVAVRSHGWERGAARHQALRARAAPRPGRGRPRRGRPGQRPGTDPTSSW